MILLVGDEAFGAAAALFPGQASARVEPDRLGAVLAGGLVPELVVAPLLGARADALETARTLEAAGYRGAFRVVTGPLPAPRLVRDEIRAAGPGLTVDLLILPAPS
jgi:hypothetical protein